MEENAGLLPEPTDAYEIALTFVTSGLRRADADTDLGILLDFQSAQQPEAALRLCLALQDAQAMRDALLQLADAIQQAMTQRSGSGPVQ